jgi:thiol-disulfide isomerase/thioredoxin
VVNCVKELPSFQAVYDRYAGQFEIVALAVDKSTNPAGFFDSNGYTFTGGYDVDGAAKYVSGGIPVTVFIDRNGNMINTQVGAMSEAQFEAEVRKIL